MFNYIYKLQKTIYKATLWHCLLHSECGKIIVKIEQFLNYITSYLEHKVMLQNLRRHCDDYSFKKLV